MNDLDHPPNRAQTHDFLLEELKDVGVFSIDLNRRITSWSPGVERILGYAEEDFIGLDVSTIFTAEDRERSLDDQEFEGARLNGRAPDMRWHVKKDGSRIFVDGVLRGVFDQSGTHVGYSKVIRDIKPSGIGDNMLSAILERTPDAIFLKDRAGRFTFVNAVMAQLLGHPAEEILGSNLEEFFPPHLAGPIRENDRALMETGSPQVIEERMLTKEHGERTYLTGKAPWSDSDGKVIGVVGIAQDFHSRKNAEEERECLLRELRRSNEDLAQFSYVVSHDLQAPLRMVQSYTQLLARRYQGQLDETADNFISIITKGAVGMEQLIQGLLRYAQAGEEVLTKAPVSVDAILDGALSNLKVLVEESSAELTREPMPVIFGDPVQLLQLFQNLLGNAMKYARADVPPRIDVNARKEDGEYRFAFTDNGLGIDTNNFERIFAPLKRLHGQEIPGTGIGLAVCQKIVERHGGRIWVTSVLGKGSTFHFTLPAA